MTISSISDTEYQAQPRTSIVAIQSNDTIVIVIPRIIVSDVWRRTVVMNLQDGPDRLDAEREASIDVLWKISVASTTKFSTC